MLLPFTLATTRAPLSSTLERAHETSATATTISDVRAGAFIVIGSAVQRSRTTLSTAGTGSSPIGLFAREPGQSGGGLARRRAISTAASNPLNSVIHPVG